MSHKGRRSNSSNIGNPIGFQCIASDISALKKANSDRVSPQEGHGTPQTSRVGQTIRSSWLECNTHLFRNNHPYPPESKTVTTR